MIDQGVGIFGSSVFESTKGLGADEFPSTCPATSVQYAHNNKLNPINSVSVGKNRLLLGDEHESLELVFMQNLSEIAPETALEFQ